MSSTYTQSAMFYRLGLFAYRWRYAVIVVWIVLVVAALPFVPRVQSVLHGGGFANGVTDSDRALTLMQNDLHDYPSAVTVIFSDPRLTVDDAAFQHDMESALTPLCSLRHLARIETYVGSTTRSGGLCASHREVAGPSASADAGSSLVVSPDRHTTYAILDFSSPLEVTQALLPRINHLLHTRVIHAIVGGDPSVYADMERLSTDDLAQVEKYTFPVALALLVLIFGTLVAAGVPLMIGGVSVVLTLAAIYLVGRLTTMSTFALNTSTMIGLGVGIDYALLIVSRYREEARYRSPKDAVATTMAQAGKAVLFSGCTVIVGLSGLLMFQALALRSMGIGGALVVIVAVLAALTLAPAVLGVVGSRIDALTVLPWRRSEPRFWPYLARAVMRRPWLFIVGTLAVIVVIALPARELRLNIPDATILPRSVPSRRVFDTMQRTFKVDQNAPILPVVDGTGPILEPAKIAALYVYTRRIAHDADVRTVQSIVTLSPRLGLSDYLNLPAHLASPGVAATVAPLLGSHSTLIAAYPRPGLSDARTDALVRRIRAIPIGGGLHVVVGGYSAGKLDYIQALYGDFPKAVLFVLGSTFVILFLLFRSVILPLKAVMMNVFSVLGSYGALVFIFQQGHLSNVFNFTSDGYVDEITPIVMFCVLFGLSMDYEVFLLTRIREEYLATGDNERAVALGLARTGRIITSAALILVIVAGSFAFTNLILVKAVGVGLALAILIDATLIRSLLVPATMRVLGRWNWWSPV